MLVQLFRLAAAARYVTMSTTETTAMEYITGAEFTVILSSLNDTSLHLQGTDGSTWGNCVGATSGSVSGKINTTASYFLYFKIQPALFSCQVNFMYLSQNHIVSHCLRGFYNLCSVWHPNDQFEEMWGNPQYEHTEWLAAACGAQVGLVGVALCRLKIQKADMAVAVWKHLNNPIKSQTKIIVKEGQPAVIFRLNTGKQLKSVLHCK